MQPELRRYIQHISLSPDSLNNDDVGAFCTFIYIFFFFGGHSCTKLFPHATCQCDSPSGRRPSNEVLTRHDGYPHRQPCEGEPYEVITPPSPRPSTHDENCLIYFFLHTGTCTRVWFSTSHVCACADKGSKKTVCFIRNQNKMRLNSQCSRTKATRCVQCRINFSAHV